MLGIASLLSPAGCQGLRSPRTGGAVFPVRHEVSDRAAATAPGVAAARLERSAEVLRTDLARERGERADREAENPLGLAQERHLRRAGDDGTIPPNALLIAKGQAEQMPVLEPEVAERDAGLWSWTWLGPGNVGGRARSLSINGANPSDMLLGSVSGGLWRTLDGGGTWWPVNDWLPSLAISCMIADPTNANVIYAGTGEGFANGDALPGAGVFKSIDGGATWTQLTATVPTAPDPTTDQWGYVNRLAISSDGATLLAATNSGIWRSTNGGVNWTQVTASRTLDVKFHPTDSIRAIAGRDNGTAQWSTDGGQGWNNVSLLGGRLELAYARSSPNIVYASVDLAGGSLYRSTDGGQNYTLRNSGTSYFMGGNPPQSQGWYDNVVWVAPDNPDLVVVGGIDLWRSPDGGTTLTQISDWSRYHNPGDSAHADQHLMLEHPGYGPGNRRVYVCNDGGIQTTADITTAVTTGWTNLAHNLGITQFYGGAASADGLVVLGGAQDNDTLRLNSGDGPSGWYQAKTGDGGFCAIHPTTSVLRYCEFVNLAIFRNHPIFTDSWTLATTGLTDAGNQNTALFIAPFVIAPSDGSRLYAGGRSIWRTTDGASNWAAIRGPQAGNPRCSAIDIATGDANRVWVGYEDGRVSRSLNAGGGTPTWTDVDANGPAPLPNRFVTDIAVSPGNPAEVFVTFGGYATDTVWFTSDDGATWQQRTGSGVTALPQVQVNTVRVNPMSYNWVYAGTDIGVFASEDRGLTWNRTPAFGDHDGPVNTEVSELFWQGNDYLIAATHGRGMYRARPLPVVWVNGAYVGPELGTSAQPYNTISEGLDAAGNGTTIVIQGGIYDEAPLLFTKRTPLLTTGGTVVIH